MRATGVVVEEFEGDALYELLDDHKPASTTGRRG
jgi:hypothetical protein